MINVFKFGGASVDSAEAVQNVARILQNQASGKTLIVLSAMGKMTNALELLADSYFNQMKSTFALFNDIKTFHYETAKDLFEHTDCPIFADLDQVFDDLASMIAEVPNEDFNLEYDRIVSFGELLSTKILFHYLRAHEFSIAWADARDMIETNSDYRNALVDWTKSPDIIKQHCEGLFSNYDFVISQGFIARTKEGNTSTLGREGSDFSAAIFAYALDAEGLTIWKDVPGLLNADPKFFENTQKLDKVSFKETIELAYYGASIIHPKTIKPLQNKNIPLYIKSFVSPDSKGSVIQADTFNDQLIPSYIFKKNQVLISISPRDFSFIAESNLAKIFLQMTNYSLKANLMQNSAISFSICIDEGGEDMIGFIQEMQNDYKVRYNRNMELITIRHYNQQIIDDLIGDRKVYLEQKNRSTIQLLVR
ncbi:MAG: aspartate kinase [Bacteroidales bacterium]|nr:aspartate kinase [Bacteroidales bacterium]